MRRPLLVLLSLSLALVAAGCGVRTTKPFTATGSAGCLTKHGFKDVTTSPGKVGLIAGFADNGGIRALSPKRNVLTIAFTDAADSVSSTEEAFRKHAPPSYRTHMRDIMETSRNAVIVWTVAPDPGELDTVNRCLAP